MLFPPDIYGYAELHKAKFQNPNFSVTRGRDRVCLAFIFRQDLSKAYKCISIKLGWADRLHCQRALDSISGGVLDLGFPSSDGNPFFSHNKDKDLTLNP